MGFREAIERISFVDDLAQAVLYVLENKLSNNIYNIGTGHDFN